MVLGVLPTREDLAVAEDRVKDHSLHLEYYKD